MAGYVYSCARWVRPAKLAELTGMTQDQITGDELPQNCPKKRSPHTAGWGYTVLIE